MPYRRRVLVSVATVVLLAAPVALLATFAETSVAADVRARSGEDRVRTAQLASSLLDDQLLDVSRDIALVARRSELVRELRMGDVLHLTADLASLRASTPAITTALAFGPALEFVAVDASPDALQPIGSRAATSSRPSPISDPSERAWLESVLKSDVASVAPVYRSPWVDHL